MLGSAGVAVITVVVVVGDAGCWMLGSAGVAVITVVVVVSDAGCWAVPVLL